MQTKWGVASNTGAMVRPPGEAAIALGRLFARGAKPFEFLQ